MKKFRFNFERIVELRKDKGLNQAQMAAILKIPKRTYAHYEYGDVSIPIHILYALSRFHETSADYLIGLTDERKPYRPSRSYKLIQLQEKQELENN